MTQEISVTTASRSTLLGHPWLAAALLGLASTPALALKPFTANYTAHYMGLQANGVMRLDKQGERQWTYSLAINNPAANLVQRTTFEEHGGQWRPLSGEDSSQVLIKRRNTTATFDWSKGEARWSGDVKDDRKGPIALQPGDMDAMLINLAIVRDVPGGKPLNYRMVENGKVSPQTWRVEGKEAIEVGGTSHQATKVSRTSGDKQMILWVVDSLPAPARVLQRKDGKDEMDLRLESVR